MLFDCSIRENICYAKADASEEEIVAACKEANAYDFIQKLPMQLDTNVGEGGAQLSGGQKQRIAIARALIRSPKLLLLDEATSALDTESEAVVQAALDRLHSGRTTLVIAHRLSTVRNADLIVAIEDGQVKEQGSHSELMAMGGLYSSLVERQMAGKEETLAIEEPSSTKESSKGGLEKQVSRSKSVKKAKADTIEKEEEKGQLSLMFRLIALNSPEWPWVTIGSICAIAFGTLMAFFGEIFGHVIGAFSITDIADARTEMMKWSLAFVGIGLGTFLVQFLMGLSFSIAGARLVERVRRLMFEAMLNQVDWNNLFLETKKPMCKPQEIGWFDEESHNTGALCARLSTSAEAVASAGGGKISSETYFQCCLQARLGCCCPGSPSSLPAVGGQSSSTGGLDLSPSPSSPLLLWE